MSIGSENGMTPLHRAAYGGHVSAIRLLVDEYGADVSVRSENGMTPLHDAASNGDADGIRALLHRGANPEARTYFNDELQRRLLRDGARREDIKGRLPLHVAARNGHVEAIRLLMEVYGPGLTDEGPGIYPPLHEAAQRGHVEAVRALVDLGADVRDRTWWGGYTPLHTAAYGGHLLIDVIRGLVDLGADVDARATSSATRGMTPLHRAAWGGHVEAIQVLAELGANVEAVDWNGDTPRDRARRNGHTDAAYLLRRLEEREVFGLIVEVPGTGLQALRRNETFLKTIRSFQLKEGSHRSTLGYLVLDAPLWRGREHLLLACRRLTEGGAVPHCELNVRLRPPALPSGR